MDFLHIEFWSMTECLDMFRNAEKDFLKTLKAMEDNDIFIGNVYIELCAEIGKLELAEHYKKYREIYIERQERTKGA